MKITRVVLENFRGIKDFKLDTNGGKDVDILGANGTGKTTVGNAISWLLCDCPITGEKEFSPKTADVHQETHFAEIELVMDDGMPISFGKAYKEVWQKKRNLEYELTGHKTEYFVNGTSSGKRAYEATVESATNCHLDKLKLLMIIGDFMSLSTTERRQILFDIIPEVDDDEIIAKTAELESFKDVLKVPRVEGMYYKPNEYKEAVTVQKKNLQKELTSIPARIDELEKQLPNFDTESIEDIESEIGGYQIELESNQKELLVFDNPTELLETQKKVNALKEEQLTKKTEFQNKYLEYNKRVQEIIDTSTERGIKINNELQENKSKYSVLKNKIAAMQNERDKMLKEYQRIAVEQWDVNTTLCPTCKQELPTDKLKIIQKRFNDERREKLNEINKRGQECSKAKIDELKNEANQLKTIIDKQTQDCENLRGDIKKMRPELKDVPDFDETVEGIELKNRLAFYEKDIADFNVVSDDVKKNLNDKISELNAKIKDAYKRMSVISNGLENVKRIDELKKQQRDFGAQLEQIEHGLEMCHIFTMEKARAISRLINEKFKHVQFKLFEEQLNGGLKEICDPVIENSVGQEVRYKSANTAAQINASLEIINVINSHYQTSIPIILDKAESVTEPINVPEQLIRLIVSPEHEKLFVVTKDKATNV